VAHCVTGLIAKSMILEAFSRAHSLHQPVALLSEFAILPLRDLDLDSFLVAPSSFDIEGFRYLSDRLLDVLRLASHQGMLMYFETNYFGGQGCQGTAVFQHGQLIFGPLSAKTAAINQGLKLLGIGIKPPARDEFETIGLGRHRHTESWIKLSAR
jgi:hypothetical protein